MNKKTILLTSIALAGIFFTQSKIHANSVIPNYYEFQRSAHKGQASWYSERSPGINKRTANNEVFDDSGMTAAMWGVPFNQRVRVTNLENGKSIVVRVNDRGPHKRYARKGRIIDLSKSAFSRIASLKKGLININLELL